VIQQQDQVGLVACGDRVIETIVPPRSRAHHLHDVLAVLDHLMSRGARGDESPSYALGRIAELSRRRRSLIVLASDLFDTADETLQALAQLRAQRHDVSVIHVLHPDERSFPYEGLTEFQALESAHKMLVNPAAIRRDYLARMEQFLTTCRDTLARSGID